ncbi:hypothetical protein NE399_24580, partial [Streptomyces sp. Isolate_219]|nr:hypothetical protein [Streptomyces sp. Isolate_219]
MTRTTTPTSPATPTPTAPAPWSDLVSAALLGTERRTPPVAARPGQTAAAALLDAAAVSTVRRRAALRPAPAGERPADRKSVVYGKSFEAGVDHGGGRINK